MLRGDLYGPSCFPFPHKLDNSYCRIIHVAPVFSARVAKRRFVEKLKIELHCWLPSFIMLLLLKYTQAGGRISANTIAIDDGPTMSEANERACVCKGDG